MKRKKMKEVCEEGRLPAMAPLANAYVPFQLERSPKYNMRKAFVRGTLFPGLDLPFLGMVNQHEKPITPLTELQAIAFTIQELALYLDTHRDDCEALEVYQALQKLQHDAKEEYEKLCGPLTHLSVTEHGKYRWLDDPWPWEYSKNREV